LAHLLDREDENFGEDGLQSASATGNGNFELAHALYS
jgi:hypothetical protein